MTQIQGIDHVELFVSDLDEAVHWYGETFGFTPVKKYSEWVGNGPFMIAANDDSTMIALFEGDAQGSHPSRGLHRLAFQTDAEGFIEFVEDSESAIDVYDEYGSRISELEPVDHDLTYSVYFRDPFGNRLEVTTEDYSTVQTYLANLA